MMKTTNTLIVLSSNNAILMTQKSFEQKKYKIFSASTGFVSALQALEFILDKIDNNDTLSDKVNNIHVPDMLKGFTGHSFREYVRTNKTSGGRAFTDEEKQLVLSVATKMMNKGLNCEVKESKFFPKELKAMKDLAIKTAKEMKTTAPVAQPTTAPTTKSPVVAKLEELMAKALEEGDFDTYDKLEERLNKALGQAQPQEQEPQQESQEEYYEEEDSNEVEVDEDVANLDC